MHHVFVYDAMVALAVCLLRSAAPQVTHSTHVDHC